MNKVLPNTLHKMQSLQICTLLLKIQISQLFNLYNTNIKTKKCRTLFKFDETKYGPNYIIQCCPNMKRSAIKTWNSTNVSPKHYINLSILTKSFPLHLSKLENMRFKRLQ